MQGNDIRERVVESIAKITGIPATDIPDTAAFRGDLGLDSLSLLELTVDIEYAFRIKVPEARFPELTTVADTVRVIQEYLPASGA
jgi:acyl carrier protein